MEVGQQMVTEQRSADDVMYLQQLQLWAVLYSGKENALCNANKSVDFCKRLGLKCQHVGRN